MHINEIINYQIITSTCGKLTKIPYFLSTIKLVYISHYGYVTKLLLQDEEGYCKFSLHFTLWHVIKVLLNDEEWGMGEHAPKSGLRQKTYYHASVPRPHTCSHPADWGSQTSYQIWSYITFNWYYSYTHRVLAFLRMMLSLYLLNPTLDSGFLSLHR